MLIVCNITLGTCQENIFELLVNGIATSSRRDYFQQHPDQSRNYILDYLRTTLPPALIVTLLFKLYYQSDSTYRGLGV